jgi:predicted small integral membrane protein
MPSFLHDSMCRTIRVSICCLLTYRLAHPAPDPTYMIRAIPTTSGDRVYCTVLGQGAVHGAFAGFTDVTVGLINTHVSGRLTAAAWRDEARDEPAPAPIAVRVPARAHHHPGPPSGGCMASPPCVLLR